MVVALISAQLVGFTALYLILRRRLNRAAQGSAHLDSLRTQVGALITELNATAERNITLLEDRIQCVEELLQAVDRQLGTTSDQGAAVDLAARRDQVMRLRRLGFSTSLIADRLSTSRGEVELIVNLAADGD